MMQNRIILLLSIPLAGLLILVSCVGLLTPGFYAAETQNWQVQSIGQDLVDLFLIAPCLLITSISAYRSNRKAIPAWGGVMLYLAYTFDLYCFDVHFNMLFVFYCLGLSLSFYSLVYFLFIQYKQNNGNFKNKKTTRLIGIYFITISVLFYFLWLAEIIPAIIQHTIPKSIIDAGLFTNGVHVLDLAIVLPLIFLSGIFLLKRKPFGLLLAPVILTFFVLMDITIAALSFIMNIKGMESNLMVTTIMCFFAAVSLWLLFRYFKSPGTIDR
jgi:hypothetical protein